jgi:hypothetical protein
LAAPAADFFARNIPLWLQKSFLVRSKIIYKKSYHTNQNSLLKLKSFFKAKRDIPIPFKANFGRR